MESQNQTTTNIDLLEGLNTANEIPNNMINQNPIPQPTQQQLKNIQQPNPAIYKPAEPLAQSQLTTQSTAQPVIPQQIHNINTTEQNNFESTMTMPSQANTVTALPSMSIEPTMDIHKINLYNNENESKFSLNNILNWVKNNILTVIIAVILICCVAYFIYKNRSKIFKCGCGESKEQVFFNY